MQPLQPEQATFLLQMALPALKSEHRTTRKIIEAVPEAHSGYRPDEHSKSALELAWHIASAEVFFMNSVASGEFDFGISSARPDSIDTPAAISAWYAEAFAASFERLTQLSAEQLTKIVDFRGMFQMPAVMYLQASLNHIIHHRGQLSVYLRPMGAKVPSIYGVSYDDAVARKAAQSSATS
ncbi:MAG: DinB family protein [Bryobacteraceae bacterium]|jgi:uncharacterized damage-inducible protein DinB